MSKQKEIPSAKPRKPLYVPFEARAQEGEVTHFSEADILKQEENFIKAYGNPKRKPIRVLFSLYRGHYAQLFLSGLFFLIKTSPVWFLPIVTERVIDIAATGEPASYGQIFWWLLTEFVLVVLNVPTHYAHIRFLSLANRSVEAGLRGAMVRKLQQLSIGFHKEMESGRIQSKIIRDVESIEGLSSQIFTSVLSIIINITVALVAVVSTNLTVFAFFIACAPVASVLTFAFRKDMRTRNREFREEVERTSATVMEMEELVPVARAHALENKEVRRMTYQLNLVAEKGYRLDVLQSMFGAAGWVVFQIFQIICLAVTTYMALNGIIKVGFIVMYQSYFGTVVGQISALLSLLPILTKGTESIRSVGEILQAHDIEDNSGKEKVREVKGEYQFKDVSFQYDEDTHVLNHLNLTVKAGETIALVGNPAPASPPC